MDGFGVFVHGGRKPTGRDAVEWAKEAEERGAGEILLTSMDRDGTGIGFDCELTRAVGDAVRIPVIASGGAGGAKAFCRGIRRDWACGRGAGGVHLSFWVEFVLRLEAATALCRNSREVALLIPSIDLMGGKIVQLVQGKKKASRVRQFRRVGGTVLAVSL